MSGEQFWLGVGVGAFLAYAAWAAVALARMLTDNKMRRLHEAMQRHPSNGPSHQRVGWDPVHVRVGWDVPDWINHGPHRRG